MAEGLRHREKLLSDLAYGLQKYEEYRLVDLRVQLFRGRKMIMEFYGVAQALLTLVEGDYYDGDTDWSKADSLGVEPF